MPEIPESVTGNNREEWLFADFLINQVTQKAAGAADPECHYNYPRDVYFIGNLRPREDDNNSLSRADFMQKLSPSAFGAEFKLNSQIQNIKINVSLNWDCYYRAIPSYQQQIYWARNQNQNQDQRANENDSGLQEETSNEGEDLQITDSQTDRQNDRQPREDLFIRFKKVKCSATGQIRFVKTDSNGWDIGLSELESSIRSSIQSAIRNILEDNERIRLRVAGRLFTIPQDALADEDSYREFINELVIEANNHWSWSIVPEVFQTDSEQEEVIILLQFVNSTEDRQNDRTIETYLFNTSARFQFDPNVVQPFELELAPKSFRYDRNMWGRGFNCGLIRNGDNYYTTHTPIYSQLRYKTREEPSASFEDLASDPIPALKTIMEAMNNYLHQWDEQERIFASQFGEQWENNHRQEYFSDKDKYLREIERFKLGLSLIEKDNDIQYAFRLANESFRRAGLDKDGNPKKDRWRLFQIVFMVTQVPGIVSLNPDYAELIYDREFVDIVYFPTGGGKTEAYLSVLIFHCFYDRLRGKNAGVTSWIRFPLRLLTLQQTQRLADIIGIAEIVRSEQSDNRLIGREVDSFAVGYFVGAEATPNEIVAPINGKIDPTWSLAQDARERQRWKRVVTCPSCKTKTIVLEFDEERVKILHRCTNHECRFPQGIIPVYVIDNEIYRFLPSVMVGTIDKLAGIGNQRKFSLIFGKVDGQCEVHGYFNSICCQKECRNPDRLIHNPPNGISGPTLFIQDELHLLKEGLGTFDSHYETFTQYLLQEPDDRRLKIIASSATIEQYERQVEHLYGKNRTLARVFPGIGPTLRSSFYAQTENYPQRIFVGILPHNKTIFNAVLEVIEFYHRILQIQVRNQSGINPYLGSITPGEQSWYNLLDLYYSTLTYFLSTRDLGSIKNDIESHINNTKYLNEGLNAIQIKELTGGTTTDEVTRILEQIESFHSPDVPHESVLATNMVSHGVDVDRFNCMIFYGVPRQNAEYIQASSRVGRSHVGIIFCCFHPIRERDQSHYSYFNKYHEFLGQLVEPVAINRWSAYGIDKTLPGLFMGTILQILSNREDNINRNSYYMLDKISQMYQSHGIEKDEIKNILKNAFRASIQDDERNLDVERKIDRTIDIYFDNISNPGTEATFVSEALIPKPMRSLRDIDEPIPIELGRLGERWGNMK